jgi:1,4-dihydroxy-2-naphthoate octaprenyltransferase
MNFKFYQGRCASETFKSAPTAPIRLVYGRTVRKDITAKMKLKTLASALLGVTLLFSAATAAYSYDDHGKGKDKDHKEDKKHKEEKKKQH